MHNPPNPDLLSQCAWCRRMLIENEYRLASPLPGFRVTHGICPDCAPILLKDIPAAPFCAPDIRRNPVGKDRSSATANQQEAA